jgi:hypothetical protein
MPSSDAFALPHSGLNEFLFASVGTEPSGMTLSVLSVFARLGDDPWEEAGKLAGLPKGEAIKSLAQAITSVPRSVWTLPDATTIATGLVALLPTRLGNTAPGPSNVRGRPTRTVRIGLLLVVAAFGMAFAVGLFTSHPATKFDGGRISKMTPVVIPSTR